MMRFEEPPQPADSAHIRNQIVEHIEDPTAVFGRFEARMKAQFGGFEAVPVPDEKFGHDRIDFRVPNPETPGEFRQLGHVVFRYRPGQKDLGEENVLYVDEIEGKRRAPDEYHGDVDAWKPDGIGTALFAFVLTKYPETEEIRSVLIDDNAVAIRKAIQEGAPTWTQEDRLNLLKVTPAYKIRKKFGFTEVVASGGNEIDLVVQKPKSKA